MTRFTQLIFDCDGVLVDTEIVAAEVMVKLFQKYDIDITLDEYLANYTGKIISSLFNDLLSADQLKEVDINQLSHQCDLNIYNQLREVNGMTTIVKALPMPKSVVSNSRLWQVEKAIQHLEMENTFDGNLFSSEMVTNPKPFPDIYLHTAKSLHVSPDQCLVVEDSKSGVKAAVAAGMTVIGFAGASHIRYGHGDALLELGAREVAYSAGELRDVIHRFF